MAGKLGFIGKDYTPLKVCEEIDWGRITDCVVIYNDGTDTTKICSSSSKNIDLVWYEHCLRSYNLDLCGDN